jgi:fatty acid desaturase
MLNAHWAFRVVHRSRVTFKVVGAVSIVSWFMVLYWGRMLPFCRQCVLGRVGSPFIAVHALVDEIAEHANNDDDAHDNQTNGRSQAHSGTSHLTPAHLAPAHR